MRPFRFNLFVDELHGRAQLQQLARRAEDLGFATLLVGDHVGLPSPFPVLVSAAAVTTRLRVGTRVLNTALAHPLRLAQDIATTDVLVDGRLEVGLGAGWAREESELLGVQHLPVAVRAARLGESIEAMRAAWAQDTDEDLACHRSIGPRLLQRPAPPLMIGGHGDAVLAVAGRQADIVGFTGATVIGGEYRPNQVARGDLEDRIAVVRMSAGARFPALELGVKVIVVAMRGAAEEHAARLAVVSGVPVAAILDSPFAFLGPPQRVADQLRGVRAELGVTSFDVPAWAVDDVAPLVAELAG